jgi:hypothetical protein
VSFRESGPHGHERVPAVIAEEWRLHSHGIAALPEQIAENACPLLLRRLTRGVEGLGSCPIVACIASVREAVEVSVASCGDEILLGTAFRTVRGVP